VSPSVVVVGLGEVGQPLLELLREAYPGAVGIDVEPVELPERGTVDVLHVCFPFEVPDFVGEVARYVDLLDPRLTVVNSTVAVGTTREIADRTGTPVASSPVRGKHAHMLEDMRRYAKFVAGIDEAATAAAVAHFEGAGLRTTALSAPEACELAKLSETTYFGVLIAWAQEVERYCDQAGVAYDEVVGIYEEIGFFPPVKYVPGVIGGHCVMPNIEILGALGEGILVEAVKASNERKVAREAAVGTAAAV
jgi:UDP-N-acetyl-D-mannosaminuronate dehydrogenase